MNLLDEPRRTSGNLDSCRGALQKLHSISIAHGRLRANSFLIRKDIPISQIQFFYLSDETKDPDHLDKEMSIVEEVLRQCLQKPVHNYRHNKEITVIQECDGYIHLVMFWLINHEDRIGTSQDDYRDRLVDSEKKN